MAGRQQSPALGSPRSRGGSTGGETLGEENWGSKPREARDMYHRGRREGSLCELMGKSPCVTDTGYKRKTSQKTREGHFKDP
jgi:hypothetical protein